MSFQFVIYKDWVTEMFLHTQNTETLSFFYIKSRKVYMELSVQAGQKDEDEAHVIANWTVIPTAAREHKL